MILLIFRSVRIKSFEDIEFCQEMAIKDCSTNLTEVIQAARGKKTIGAKVWKVCTVTGECVSIMAGTRKAKETEEALSSHREVRGVAKRWPRRLVRSIKPNYSVFSLPILYTHP